MNLNKAELIGNLVADPIVKSLPSGQSIANFRMATSHIWRDVKTKEKKESTEYHPIIAWGKLGGVVEKYLKKGDKVYIDGRLHSRTWAGKDGAKHTVTEIVAQNLIMLGGAKRKSEQDNKKVNDEVVVEEIDMSKESAEK
ncbi:MAG: single-stranded DNA-binding protein [Patescibacteria group bacterium]|jgi:single-strand DNA-binding protein